MVGRATVILGAGLGACVSPEPLPGSPEAATSPAAEPDGPSRLLFGKVHDYQDHNLGLFGATVSSNGRETQTDATGMFRLEAPTPLDRFETDATELGYAPLVVHLDDWGELQSFWPPMVPVDDVTAMFGLMSATAPIAPTMQEDQAALIFQVLSRGSTKTFIEGAEIDFTIDGEPAPYVYPMTSVAGTCLPVRSQGGPVTTDMACDGAVLIPEIADGAEVRIDLRHSERLCARNHEQRLLGFAYDELSYRITAVAGSLNATGVECVPPDKILDEEEAQEQWEDLLEEWGIES